MPSSRTQEARSPETLAPVASVDDNRTTSVGLVTPTGKHRTMQQIITTLAAGATQQFAGSGDNFYVSQVSVAEALLTIRPKGGGFLSYAEGQGYITDPDNMFAGIEIMNATGAPLTFTVWYGFGRLIDNRAIPF